MNLVVRLARRAGRLEGNSVAHSAQRILAIRSPICRLPSAIGYWLLPDVRCSTLDVGCSLRIPHSAFRTPNHSRRRLVGKAPRPRPACPRPAMAPAPARRNQQVLPQMPRKALQDRMRPALRVHRLGQARVEALGGVEPRGFTGRDDGGRPEAATRVQATEQAGRGCVFPDQVH
jgi:hypothetical protein